MMIGVYNDDGVMAVDNVALPEIAKAVGTPCYIYAAAHIKHQYQTLSNALSRALPPARQPMICYAVKANSHIAVLSYLRTLGSGVEIVSEGELVRALKAGFKGEQIVATGVGKQDPEIAALLSARIHQINVESLPELERIQKIAAQMNVIAPVVFRLNPNIGGGGHEKITTGRKKDKFGLSDDAVMTAYAQAKDMPNITTVGLSMHIGSQVFEVEKFKDAFSRIPSLVQTLRGHGYDVSRLDIGGGFPIIYRDEKLLDLSAYAQWVRDIIAPLNTQIIFEPGRYLVGNAGLLLTKVLFVKDTGERKFLILDCGMNDLIRPAMYDSYHSIRPVVENKNAVIETYDVVGPVCETGDTFTKERTLPRMAQGDLCVIDSAGAYGASMASNYNTRPLIAEVFVNNGRFDVIRPRQTYEDIIGAERIPDWAA
jgi:diaminopimelate decarboxylase